MSDSYFDEGGPFHLKRSGPDEITMRLPVDRDSTGMIARECTDNDCAPGYFKVKPGTGITSEQETAYCPYCRRSASPSDFLTAAQLQYAKDAVFSEVAVAFDRAIQQGLGLGPSGKKSYGNTVSLSYKPGGRPHVARPVEEELRRDICCPHCTLEHAVFGLATWCPDCGGDVFHVHLDAELEVIRKILAAVETRRETLGSRVAGRDVENALEDTVSVFEAVLKTIAKRQLILAGKTVEEADGFLEKTVRSQFQSPRAAADIWSKQLGLELFSGVPAEQIAALTDTFEKRHPITHNLGIVDRKYLQKAASGGLVGRDVRVSAGEVEAAIVVVSDALLKLYARLFKADKT